ncbi:ThuA domain-containing protein [Herbiconiux liukaitaii]|uniref:ThuA domain-containing protein n=1 Tax=Herbiconiux liukaitaii TaxID=3342799 RepID=UPI0035BA829C
MNNPMAERIVLLLSGSGRYADPWHPFSRTSARLAELIREEGFVVAQPENIDQTLADHAAGPLPDLVVADLGRPQDGTPTPSTALGQTGLKRLLRNRPLLAVHAAVSTFADSPAWTTSVGARWIPGASWHPDRGQFTAHVAHSGTSPIGPLAPFALDDERYLDLQLPATGRTVLYRHQGENSHSQPSIWIQDIDGVRSAYDAYGHDESAYESEEHRDIIRRIIHWLTTRR